MRCRLLIVLLLVASSARAERSIELVGGLAAPFVNQDWRDHTKPTVKAGARAIVQWPLGRFRLGFDAQLDLAPIYDFDHAPTLRTRLLAGPRLGVLVSPRWQLFARGELGADHIIASDCDHDLRFAIEVGLGLTRTAGAWRYGGQVNLPIAVGEEPMNRCYFVPRVSHDFDFLVTAQHAL